MVFLLSKIFYNLYVITLYENLKNRNMKITNYLLLLGVLVTLSCERIDSNNLKLEVPFYQDYKVTYNKEKNTLVAEATFRANDASGVRLELNSPAKITCNGKTSNSFLKIGHYFYSWDFEGKKDVNFVLINNKGKSFNNQILFSNLNDITIPDDLIITLDGNTNFTWIGTPLQKNESISAKIVQGEEYFTFSFDDRKGATSFKFPKAFLDNFKKGEASLIITRSLIKSVTEGDLEAGGELNMAVVTKNKIELK